MSIVPLIYVGTLFASHCFGYLGWRECRSNRSKTNRTVVSVCDMASVFQFLCPSVDVSRNLLYFPFRSTYLQCLYPAQMLVTQATIYTAVSNIVT